MVDTKKAFYESKNTRIVEADPRDEWLHPEARETERGAELTETQFLGFNVPDHDIMGIGYLWHHPNLATLTGGAFAWQGLKPNPLSCELFDMLVYLDDSPLAGDYHDVVLPNSYRSQVIEPFDRFRISYRDELGGNAFDVEYEALAPPMVLETGCHLEQPMKTHGSVTLAGRRYDVDGYTVRDRSWGQLRRENSMEIPPLSWMNCAFGPDLAFGATAFDTEDGDPEWKEYLSIPGGDPLRHGWIFHDGEYTPVVDISKRTLRDQRSLVAQGIECTLTAADGYVMRLRGTVTAATTWRPWLNMDNTVCLVRWECGDRIGWGDFQDVLYASYVRRFAVAGPA